ncbi:MAG TPA: prolipoprotein diacylglyceryl transferase family protein [Pirellulales bacterium]|jgi:phosphatidylglycerol:prolipoprotein diacylglycerol transferase|nr:prolipoprotein diacylglyceryl transferase family protein [Pirellulales bacterium]
MLQTLFYIPDHLFGIPLFGPLGLLFIIWAVIAVIVLGRLVYRQGISGDVLSAMGMLALVGAAICFYLPSLLIKDAGLPIRGYGVMVLLGVVAGVWLAVRRARKRGIDVELIFNLALWLFIGGIIGARLFYVFEYWGQQFYRTDSHGQFDFAGTLKAALNIAQGGLVIYGALIGGGVAGLLFWLRHRNQPMLRIADVIAPSMALGLGIGRIGCFLNGCCFGSVAEDLPWAVKFPEQSPPYMRQIENGQLYLHGLAFRGKPDKAGATISAVEPDSDADKAGLQADEKIVQIYEQPTSDAKSQVLLYPKADPEKTGQAADAEPDATLGAAERALMAIKGEGTKIVVYTEDREKPVVWAITRPNDLPAKSLPVHPTQLYSALDAVLLCLLLLAFDPFRRRDGEVLALMLTVHPIARFLLESIRTDEPKMIPLPFGTASLTISQFLSVMMFVGAIGLWAFLILRRPRLDGSDLPEEGLDSTGADGDIPPAVA